LAVTDAHITPQRIVLDPWFTGEEVTDSPKRFLFTFPDSDDPYISEDRPDSHDNSAIPPPTVENHPMPLVDDEPEDDLPRIRFDVLCDQTLEGKVAKSRARKPTNPKKRPKGLVSKLDIFEASARRRAEKRQKVSHQANRDKNAPPQSQPFPFLPELSDSEDPPLNPSLPRKSAKVSMSGRRTTVQPCFYPEPSSSQDSHLSYGPSEDFLDLTI
jgi:hypothetical protein